MEESRAPGQNSAPEAGAVAAAAEASATPEQSLSSEGVVATQPGAIGRPRVFQHSVSPIFAVVAIAATLALILWYGFKTTLAPKPYVIGIRPDGKPMTQEDEERIREAFSRGRYKSPILKEHNVSPLQRQK